MEDLKKASELLSTSGDSELERISKDWEEVFASRTALALSFRKGRPEFLDASADFDYPALDLLVDLCKRYGVLGRQVNRAVVRMSVSVGESVRVGEGAGR